VVNRLIPLHPAHVLSCGRGVEALVLAILDGDHALYKGGRRLEERGMMTLLQPGLTRASLHDYRLGHILDALFAANLKADPAKFEAESATNEMHKSVAPDGP